tara:strand:+ start:149 stop:523 length:375 start_codon:yes stop_codon:yes gene_type:complete
MEINIPEIVAEVNEAFMKYEKAILANDVEMINELFWNDEKTLRYGPNGTLVSHAALSAFRRSQDIGAWERTLKDTYIVTFGRDFAVANTESTRSTADGINRQSQTWVRMPEGWRIVSAHVSEQP